MRATGRASRTDSSRHACRFDRPGPSPGRSCIALLLLLATLFASPSGAQEVFSWFNRGLLPVAFDQGDWVRYAVEEIDEYGTVRDTLTVTVVDADSSDAGMPSSNADNNTSPSR